MNRKIVLTLLIVTGTIAALFAATGRSTVFRSGSTHASAPGVIPRLDTTPAPGQAAVAHLAQVVDGQPWSITSFTNDRGQLCGGEKIPQAAADGGGQGLSCWQPQTMFDASPLVYQVGAVLISPTAGYNVWVWGIVSPKVARVALQLANCTILSLPLDTSHVFFHVFGTGAIRANIGPWKLIGYDAAGRTIATAPTQLRAIALPAAPKNCS